MDWKFEDYVIETGYTNAGHVPYATLKEFFALVGTGVSHDAAILDLRHRYEQRLKYLREAGEPIPIAGSVSEPLFAPNDQVEALRPFVEEFWTKVIGTSYSTSFVSNESRLSSWEHYVGGRVELIRRVHAVYGLDITSEYDEPVPDVIRRIREYAAQQPH